MQLPQAGWADLANSFLFDPDIAGRVLIPTMYIFVLNAGTDPPPSLWRISNSRSRARMSSNHYHARQAAAALLKMAKATSDQEIAGKLVEAAADLQEQAGELPPPISPRAPDVAPDVAPDAKTDE